MQLLCQANPLRVMLQSMRVLMALAVNSTKVIIWKLEYRNFLLMTIDRKFYPLGLLLCFTFLVLLASGCVSNPEFDGDTAFKHLVYQMELGPRTPGSQAHTDVITYIQSTLDDEDWQVKVQETVWENHLVRNIVAIKGEGKPVILLGAHYDSRFTADRDPDPALKNQPVPGANDGASGVAVLLELARVIPEDLDKEIWLVFFDAEDQGGIEGWDWILGSEAFAASLSTYPDKVVIVDMIGDSDLNIFLEQNSNDALANEVWATAADLGYQDYFIPTYKYSILDDHAPFAQLGIQAIDIIDFDYPVWHTTQDTIDQVSSTSLEIVGKTLFAWITAK